MNYQALISEAMEWMFSDITNALTVVGIIAVIGALNGVRNSLGRCSFIGHGCRRVR